MEPLLPLLMLPGEARSESTQDTGGEGGAEERVGAAGRACACVTTAFRLFLAHSPAGILPRPRPFLGVKQSVSEWYWPTEWATSSTSSH